MTIPAASAAHTALKPGPLLSLRQAETLALVAEGLQNKQIAYRLGISDATVKAHIAKIKQATGCRSRVDLALFWLQLTGRLRA
ncbi:response regulator transcription factor [Aestuariivirga sp.]|uniref:response regulator transcription factor n=1 Tax=Aestuariivirga sp. TaxID=2650926 RepID=UPI003BAAAA48